MNAQALSAVVAVFSLAGSAAFAACPAGEDTVLSCPVRDGAKALDVCISGRSITYAFGVPGQPAELRLEQDLTVTDSRPWNGIGRAMWEDVTFTNAGHDYLVFFAFDRLDAAAVPEGGVIVSRDGRELARVDCDKGTVEAGFWAVSDAKERLGLCWDLGNQAWTVCNEVVVDPRAD